MHPVYKVFKTDKTHVSGMFGVCLEYVERYLADNQYVGHQKLVQGLRGLENQGLHCLDHQSFQGLHQGLQQRFASDIRPCGIPLVSV